MNCTTDNYETLYARWLEKPGALLDWGGYRPADHKLLDLCGGTGAVAREALARRARSSQVTLLDLNPRCPDDRIRTITGRAEDLDSLAPGGDWNFIVCRQAIGYLDLFATAKALFDVSSPGALFVCNAFVRPKWSIRPYRFNKRWYLEASGFFGRQVFHLQAMSNDFDVTAFRWHSADEISKAFAPCWTEEKYEETNTTLKFVFKRKIRA